MWSAELFPSRSRHSQRKLSTLDLTDTAAPTLALLADTRIWRQRLVETFTFHDADHVGVASSYQIELPPLFVDQFVPRGTEQVNLLVPITTRPKQTLVHFGVEVGTHAEGLLLPRVAIAQLQRLNIEELCSISSVNAADLSGLTPSLTSAICSFTPAPWQEFLAHTHGDSESALCDYLSDGLGFTVDTPQVRRWRERAEPAGASLVEVLDEPNDYNSSSENVLLALPGMDPLPRDAREVSAVVDGFAHAIEAAYRAGDSDLLSVIAEYGRRWEVIIEAEIPVYRPTTIRLAEDRILGLDARGRTVQRFALGDAASVHFEARVTDNHVVLAPEFRVFDLFGRPVGVPWIESAYKTPETLSLYSSVSGRQYYQGVHK